MTFSTIRALGAVTSLVAALVLAGCGGSSSTPVSTYVASRVIAFGDEASVITNDGRKYGVNGLKSDNVTIECSVNPNWVQSLAASYGVMFPQCNPGGVASPKGRIYAEAGAKSSDLKRQIDTFLTSSTFADSDVVTVMVGVNDVVEQYQQFPALNESGLITEMQTRGENVGAQIVRIVNAGAKVVFATIADVGVSPYAKREKQTHVDVDRAALLTRLTKAFNVALTNKIALEANNGHQVGLVQWYERSQEVARFPSSFGVAVMDAGACDLARAVAPRCTTQTLVKDANGATVNANYYFWADDLNLGPVAQNQLGTLASIRAHNNPF